MKKFLIRLLIIITAAYCSQYLLYASLKTILDRKSQFRLTRYFRDKQHDYFVLGNSRAVNSVNEKYANEERRKDLINLSFNGMPYNNVVDILDDVNANNRGSTIFVEITSLLNNDIDNSYSYYLSDSKFVRKTYQHTIYDNICLLRLNNELFLRNIYYLTQSDNDWINRSTISQSLIENVSKADPVTIMTNMEEFTSRLDSLRDKCDRSGNKLIYFWAPYLPEFRETISDYSAIVKILEDDSKRYNFINLNEVQLPRESFADRLHTNYSGSILLTNSLF